jgi:hypothetical protein
MKKYLKMKHIKFMGIKFFDEIEEELNPYFDSLTDKAKNWTIKEEEFNVKTFKYSNMPA